MNMNHIRYVLICLFQFSVLQLHYLLLNVSVKFYLQVFLFLRSFNILLYESKVAEQIDSGLRVTSQCDSGQFVTIPNQFTLSSDRVLCVFTGYSRFFLVARSQQAKLETRITHNIDLLFYPIAYLMFRFLYIFVRVYIKCALINFNI